MGKLTVTFLGTGTSHGIPMIACDCAVCTSSDPRDRRSRPGVALTMGDRTVLIDTTPDLRWQCVTNNIRRVDAVLYTHAHADHILGLDDLRRFNALQGGPTDAYGDEATVARISRMFAYAMDDGRPRSPDRPSIRMHCIGGPFELFGREFIPVQLRHGREPVLGFRVGGLAYCTDCSAIPSDTWPRLAALDVLVLDALRLRPHPAHFNLSQAIEAARQLGARRTYFTHMAHEIMHARESETLPPEMAFAYDGLRIEVR